MLAEIALLAAAGTLTPADIEKPWVLMSDRSDISVYVDTRSVRSAGNGRTASALLIRWKTTPRQSETVQFEMDCDRLEYRVAGQSQWASNDKENTRRVCREEYDDVSHASDSDIARWKSGGPIYSGDQGVKVLADVFTGRFIGSSTGMALIRWCGNESREIKENCLNYLDGFRDAARASGAICDSGVTRDKIAERLLLDLRRMSDADLEKPGSALLLGHFKTAYPCR